MEPLVREAAATIARGSRSFALAARLFDPATRARALLLYAWCRHCDDVVDEQDLGMGFLARASSPQARVDRLREETLRATAGRPSNTLPFQALARVVEATGMSPRWPMAHLDGFAMDADDTCYRTLDCTLTYCFHVAGVVGVMMARAMGVPETDRATLERACDLGLAFQLDNIARDLVADAALGRSYLPDEWLAEAGIPPGEEARPCYRAELATVAARLTLEADRYRASAAVGAAALPFRSAWAVLAASGIYGAIGAKVRAAGPRAWHHRQATSTAQKLGLVVKARAQAARRTTIAHTPRDGLWTMPA